MPEEELDITCNGYLFSIPINKIYFKEWAIIHQPLEQFVELVINDDTK